MTSSVLHRLLTAPYSPSSASSSQSIESDLSTPSETVWGEYEIEGDQFCDRQFRDGIVDADFKAATTGVVKIPDLEEVSIKNVCDRLDAPCVLFGKLDDKPTGYKTCPFTLLSLFASLSGCLPIVDIQIVGSAVPWLMPTYPAQIPGIREHWNPALQAQFAKTPNDIDIRIYLSGADEATLEYALQTIFTFIALHIDDPLLGVEMKIALVKQQFLEKKILYSERDSDGNLLIEYLTVGIAPEGMPPIDILIVNKLPRLYLWQQDAMAISVGGLLCAFMKYPLHWKNRSDMHRLCRVIFEDSNSMFQAIIEKTSRIARLNNFEGVDYFSAVPLLLSAYLKGHRTIDAKIDLEKELINRFIEASNAYKSSWFNRKNWVSKVVDRAEVRKSSKRHIFILAKGILRSVMTHHQSRAEACVGKALMACRIFGEFAEGNDALLIWKEISRLQKEEPRFQSAKGFFGDVKQLIDEDPELLSCVLAWIELQAFLALYHSPDQEQKSVTIRHKAGRSVQWIDSQLHLLLPLEPLMSCFRYMGALRLLSVEQKEKVGRLCEKYKLVCGINNQRAFNLPINKAIFDDAVHLPDSLARIVYDVHFAQKVFPEFSWIEEHWHRLLGAYEAVKDRLRIVRQLLAVYGKPDEARFLSALEKHLANPKNEEMSLETLRGSIAFTMQNDRQVLRDYNTWQELRNAMKDTARVAFDKVCLERLIAFRADKAAEMLTVMVGDTVGIRNIDEYLKNVLISARDAPESKRSWHRLKGLLEKIVGLKGIKSHSFLTKDNDKLLVELLVEMWKTKCLDKDFIGLVFKLIDPKNTSSRECSRYLEPYIEKGDYAGAFELWNIGDQQKIWKPVTDDPVGTSIARLALNLEFSLEYVNLYKYFQKVGTEASFQGIWELIAAYLEKVEALDAVWTVDHANALMLVLRSPIISDFIVRRIDCDYFEKISKRIVFNETLNVHKTTFLNGKEKFDYIDAIFCVAYLKDPSYEHVKKKILERMEESVRILVQHNFIAKAGELLRLGMYQKKLLFTKQQDTQFLYTIIVESKDFVAFALYRNLLEHLGEERFKKLELEAMRWMSSASMTAWESLFPFSYTKGDMYDQISKNLWSYLCRMIMKEGELNRERSDLFKRAILFIASSDRKKLMELYGRVEQLCETHGKTSKEHLDSMLKTLFDNVVMQNESVTLENMEKLWVQRMALEKHLDITYGESAEWQDIDMHLAVISAWHPHSKHHERSLPLLLQRPPSKETTQVICKVMTSQSNAVSGQVLRYLEMTPPVECDLITFLRHPQFLQIVSRDIPRTLSLLQLVFENAHKKEHPDCGVEIISIALILIGRVESSPQKEFWLSKLTEMLTPHAEINRMLSELVHRNYEALYASIAARDEANGLLYTLLCHKVTESLVQPFSSEAAERYCCVLVEVISTLKTDKERKIVFLTIEKCLNENLLQKAKCQALGLLQMTLLNMCVDTGMVQDGSRLIKHMSSQSSNPDFFSERSSQLLKRFLNCYDKQWNPIFNTLMCAVKDLPSHQQSVLTRMKGLIALQDNVHTSPSVRIPFLFQYSKYLKTHAGLEYYREQLIHAINCKDKDLAPYIEPLFDEFFTLVKIPEKIWDRLFLVLLQCGNSRLIESVVDKTLSYVVAHYNHTEQYEDCITLLFTTLYNFPLVVRKEILIILITPGFLEKLLHDEILPPILPISCFRLLFQCFLASLPNTLEGSLKERWDEIRPRMINYLESKRLVIRPNDPEIENHASVHDEMFFFLFFMQTLQTGRWGTDVEFKDQVMTLLMLFDGISCPRETGDIYNNLPFLVMHLSKHRNRMLLDHVVRHASLSLTGAIVKDESGETLRALDGILTSYAKLLSPSELLENGTKYAETGSPVFALLFSQLMSTFLTENHFVGLENQYISYILALAQRNEPIPILDFMKVIHVYEKKKMGDVEKALLPLFFEKHHANLIHYLRMQRATPQNLSEMLRFLDILHTHLKKHFTDIFITSGASKEAQSSSLCSAPFSFDENCNLIIEMIHFWIMELQSYEPHDKAMKKDFEVLEQLKNKRNNELVNAIRNLCSSEVEMNLIITHHKLNCLKNHFGENCYDDLYENVLKALQKILNQLRTPREVATYGNIVEEFSQIDCADHAIIKAREDWIKFMGELFKNKKVVAYFHSRPQTFFKFAHIVGFPFGDPFAEISSESIWLGCTEVANRLFESKLTRRKLVVDVFVPSGVNQTELGIALTRKKMMSYMAHHQEYLQYWDELFIMKPKYKPEGIIDLLYFAYNRMLIKPEILDSLELQDAKQWRSVTAKILLKGLSNENLRSKNVKVMLSKELLLLQLAVTRGYFVEHQQDLFKAFFDIGMRWLANWEVIENRAQFKDYFHVSLSMMSQTKIPQDASGMRETVFRGLLNGLRIKDTDDNRTT